MLMSNGKHLINAFGGKKSPTCLAYIIPGALLFTRPTRFWGRSCPALNAVLILTSKE